MLSASATSISTSSVLSRQSLVEMWMALVPLQSVRAILDGASWWHRTGGRSFKGCDHNWEVCGAGMT